MTNIGETDRVRPASHDGDSDIYTEDGSIRPDFLAQVGAAIADRGDTLRADVVKGFAGQGIETCTSGYGTVFTLWRSPQPPANYKEAAAIVDPAFTVDLHLELRRAGVMSMATTYGRYYLSASHDREALDLCAGAFRQAAGRMAANSRRG